MNIHKRIHKEGFEKYSIVIDVESIMDENVIKILTFHSSELVDFLVGESEISHGVAAGIRDFLKGINQNTN